jgi:dipeptidyl aminopeptidase/acylaminoacyl peptidase
MRTHARRGAGLTLALLMATLAAPSPSFHGFGLEAQERRVLDHDAYETWRTIGTRSISADGRWVLHTLVYEDDDGELVIRAVDADREHRIHRGAQPSFTADASRVVFMIRPHVEAMREHRREGRGQADQPRDTLGILDLSSGEITRIARVRTYSLPAEHTGWLAYHLHPGDERETDEERDAREQARNGALVLRSLAEGGETRYSHVTSFDLTDDASLLVFMDAPPGEDAVPGIRAVTPGEDAIRTVYEGEGQLRQLTVDGERGQLAFVHSTTDGENGNGDLDVLRDEDHTLFLWRDGDERARAVVGSGVGGAGQGAAGVPSGWTVSPFGNVSFSRDGTRVFFGTTPRPMAPTEWSHRLDEEVNVDVWHYQDDQLMTVQRIRANQERRRSYQAVLHLDGERVVQLASPELSSVNVSQQGEGRLAVGSDSRAYDLMGSWESPNFRDVYLVDVETGERELVNEASQANASLSPDERYLTWYEPADSAWYARDIATGEVRNLSAAIPHPVHNEQFDQTRPAGSYGSAGWTHDDGRFLVYDRYDVWAVDPTGAAEPRSLTRGEGRAAGIRFRVLRVGIDEPTFAPDETVLLSAFDARTKDAGFYRTSLAGNSAPQQLLMEARSFSNPTKAADADRLLFTQETFEEFGDLWVADLDFRGRTRVSDANPQQAEYRWGTTELVEWTSTDGHRLQGVLMKPDDFDPSREYPMVVYFYERWSDGLHNHYAPVPHRSRISFPMYTSHDYLVFIPDIVYRWGYPGESSLNAVVPGVLHLLDQGFVDRDRIALQGHSWGGYQIAFMVTRTQDLFVAGAAGAPVANMTSAYGGIRWQTGLVRQFQYERTQSRLGASLWDAPMRYIENSPLFWVDKIETPLLIMHNDEDGAVPWEQGIELFTAMRRLGKPAWLINYNGEPHWPTTFANRRDWNIRMKQFFDHFLKDAPPPAWMVEGIPAVRKGETLGYQLIQGVTAVDADHQQGPQDDGRQDHRDDRRDDPRDGGR